VTRVRERATGPPTIETAQLELRAPKPSDVDALFAIQRDADAMRFTFVSRAREDTARFLDSYAARFTEDGYAPWTAVLKAERRVVGWGGLSRDPDAPEWGPEVAYFFDRRYWGRGLATELVRAATSYAFDELALPEVFAFTRPANVASRAILRKAGFEVLGYVAELERDRYVIRGAPSRR
jgi:RimJ/RimL family protein N-acetyltransferase